jgi:ring-1,2-phenylacetyl-CoA epoxidase subunit PaaB
VAVYEVFRQEKKGAAFTHAGSVVAPTPEFAEAFAHEQYGRRHESAALWVVPRDAVREVSAFHDELGKTYHRVDGYSLKAKLKEARERAGTAAPEDR